MWEIGSYRMGLSLTFKPEFGGWVIALLGLCCLGLREGNCAWLSGCWVEAAVLE